MTTEGIFAELDAQKNKMVKEIKESQEKITNELKQEFEQLKIQFTVENQKTLKDESLKEFSAQFSKIKLEFIHKADKLKLSLLNSLLEESKEDLKKFTEDSSYSEFLNNSIKAILDKYRDIEDKKIEIQVRKQDKSLLTESNSSFKINDNLHAIGGAKLHFVEKNLVIDDTLDTRFESAKRNILKEINQMIFSEIKVPKWRENEIISQILT